MNSDFYTTLKKIQETRYEKDNDNAVFHLEAELFDIQKILKKYSPESANSLKKYAEHSYNQITVERGRIKGYLTAWQNKDTRDLSSYDLGEIDEEINHFSEIVNLIDDARSDLLEHLIGLYPGEYTDTESIDLVNNLLPDSSQIKQQFLGQLENKKTSTNKRTTNDKKSIKPVFCEKIINDLFTELKDYFPNQDEELKLILQTGEDAKKPLVFYGKGIEFGHTMQYLIKGRWITAVNQSQLEAWIGRNFNYFSKSKIRIFTVSRLNQLISDSNLTDNKLFQISSDGKFRRTDK